MNIIFSSSDEDENYNIPPKKRKYWVRPFYLERNRSDAFNSMFMQLREDTQLFHCYTRMDVADFDELLSMVQPFIVKQTVVREPISPILRLAVTLR